VQVFVGTQAASPLVGELTEPKTRNRSAMEEVFIKAARIEALAMGLVYFIGQEFRRESGERGGDLTTWAAGIAKDTLRTGLDVIPVL
jgi:nucleolar MIF4G domain-containing protein 1